MLSRIKINIERELRKYIHKLDKLYSLSKASGLLFKTIKDYTLRKGKRVRPILFIIAYLGFKKKPASGLYTSALSLELLHDFLLAHDDIIDKSDIRRGKPSMHKILNDFLKNRKNIKFNGEDLTIAAADIMYAMAIHTFLLIKENKERKERALRKLIEAAIYTGTGEFIELLYGIKDIKSMNKQQIYRIYDLKTAYYTFSCPLSAGAILAGAEKKQSELLYDYGLYLGRCFQIKDDILGIFGNENKIGKSTLTDLKEGKKTLLIWKAFNNTTAGNKIIIKKILNKKSINAADLIRMRRIIVNSAALDYAKKEISRLIAKARIISSKFKMREKYKNLLSSYIDTLLSL